MIEFIQSNLSFVIFIVLLSTFLYIKRKNIVISGPFPFMYMMMYKTTWGLDKMNKWAHKHPRLFLWLAYLSAFIGIIGMFASFIFMFWQLGFIVDNGITQGGGLVLPIQTEAGLDSAVPIFYVPFMYWIIALFILAVVHEFAHGVISERFKIKVKSSGFAFLGILLPLMPAAFVEPDEKQLNSKPWWQKVAVMGAGSTSNFIFGFLFLAVWIFAAAPLIDNTMKLDKISFGDVMNESGLKGQIEAGRIISFNGEYDTTQIFKDFSNLSVNETITLEIEDLNTNLKQNYTFQTFENPQILNKGMIGISGLDTPLVNKEGFNWIGNFPTEFERAIFWIWFLNIAIGIMNLLPIWITDGGQVSKTVFTKFCGNNIGNKIYHILSWIVLGLIFFTMKPQFLFSLLGLN
jgi:membrane-associated protease RseP (regulator of RpoE activity)